MTRATAATRKKTSKAKARPKRRAAAKKVATASARPARKKATKASKGPKTTPTRASVSAFLSKNASGQARADCDTLVEMLSRVTDEPPVLWGTSMVGFGSYHYVYPTGREGDWPLIAFSPRKQNLTVYFAPGFAPFASDLARLGPHKLGQACLYLRRLADVDLDVLDTIVHGSVARVRDHLAR
jgi:hypothetical protein